MAAEIALLPYTWQPKLQFSSLDLCCPCLSRSLSFFIMASVLNTLLQMLDDGRLTDGQGRTVSFSNRVIIMTSNLGAEHLLATLSSHTTVKTTRENVMQKVRRHFRPELLNSCDEIVVFDPLSHDELKKVARLQMKDVAIRLAERGVALGFTDAALDLVVHEAYDLVYGARPLQRWLKSKVLTLLSWMLISGEIDENSKVYIDAVPEHQLPEFAPDTSSINSSITRNAWS